MKVYAFDATFNLLFQQSRSNVSTPESIQLRLQLSLHLLLAPSRVVAPVPQHAKYRLLRVTVVVQFYLLQRWVWNSQKRSQLLPLNADVTRNRVQALIRQKP